MSAHVFALPTSIAVRKLPCWFAMLYEFPVLMNFQCLKILFLQSSALVARRRRALLLCYRRTRLRTAGCAWCLSLLLSFRLLRRRVIAGRGFLRDCAMFHFGRDFPDSRLGCKLLFRQLKCRLRNRPAMRGVN